MGHVGNPPRYHYRGPVSLNMSIITIFLDPSRSKIGKISKNHVFCVFLWFKKGLKLVLHLHNSPYSMRLKQTWPYVIVLYKYFTLTDKAMYLLQGRVLIQPLYNLYMSPQIKVAIRDWSTG